MSQETSNIETIIARDSSQMYLLNRIAQMIIPDAELFSKTRVATETLAHTKTGEFEPIVFTGLDAQMLISGLRTAIEFPPKDSTEEHVAQAAALMLDEQMHEYARDINDIPQHNRMAELEAQGEVPWSDKVRSSRPFDYTEQQSAPVDMASLLDD